MTDTFLTETRARLCEFARDRDWDQFHSPKNLAMALAAEVGELIEHFQWIAESDSYKLDASAKVQVEHEIADVMLYLIRLADRLDIDRKGKLPWMSLMSTPLGSQVAQMEAEKRLQWAGLDHWARKPKGLFRDSQS